MTKAGARAEHLTEDQIDALDQAETYMFHSDFCPYLELKEMLPDPSKLARERFKILFTNYYGLNAARLNDNFKNPFFEFMFAPKLKPDGVPDFGAMIESLSNIPKDETDEQRKPKRNALHFSFVSKLVATHREASPIYDRHVRAFFKVSEPPLSWDREKRIESVSKYLFHVEECYCAWSQVPRVAEILERFKLRDQRLKDCDVVRLMDFLVWKVGNRKLLKAD